MQVAIIGQGYVGLTVALGASRAEHNVIGIDTNTDLVKRLNAGISHIEGVSNAELNFVISNGKYRASENFSEISKAEVIVIAVPTPLDRGGNPDISILESALDDIGPFLSEKSLIVNESTSFIGTLRKVIASKLQEFNPSVTAFAVSPERVDPGNLIYGIGNTPRIIGGLTPEATNRAVEFYSSFCSKLEVVSSPEVAEAAKLLENTFRFVNIGFINEFTKLMQSLEIPTLEVIEAAATKPYGFMPFFPNVGVGGHCIPVDPLYLQKNALQLGSASSYIAMSQEINAAMADFCVSKLVELAGDIQGKSVLVIGVAYKPDVSDTRESPAERVIESLRARGARVDWHDPLVQEFMGAKSSKVSNVYDLALVLANHKVTDLSSWKGKPVYCVNSIFSQPDWIPILGERVSWKEVVSKKDKQD